MKTINIQNIDQARIVINLEDNTVVKGSLVDPNYDINNSMIDDLENLLNRIETTDSKPISNTEFITNTKIISSYEDVIEHFKPANNKYFVTGITSSKFDIIDRYFKKSDFFNVAGSELPKKYASDGNLDFVEITPNVENLHTLRVGTKLKLPTLEISAMVLSENESGQYEYVLYLDTENPIKYVDFGDGLSTFTYLRSHNETYDNNTIVLFENFVDEPKITSEVFMDRGINTVFEKVKKLKMVKSINELSKIGLGYYKVNRKGFNFNNI